MPFKAEQIWREAAEPTFWLDQSLRMVWVNRAWETLTGYEASQVHGMRSWSHSPLQAGSISDLVASFHPTPQTMSGQPSSGPALIINAEGDRLCKQLDFWPFHDFQGKLIGVLGRVGDLDADAISANHNGQDLHADLIALRFKLHHSYGFDRLIGRGLAHVRLLDQVRIASSSKLPVLILGDVGTGKRAVARTIHEIGPNRDQSIHFVDVEAIPVELLEEELLCRLDQSESVRDNAVMPDGNLPFSSPKPPATLAVGDVMCLPRDIQEKLARSLQARRGARFLGLTRVDPELALRSEQIRPDLYYSLTSVVIRLAPLRDRRDEIELLAQYFLERANRERGLRLAGFTVQARDVLREYDWPGNLSELDRVVRYASERGSAPLIHVEDLPASIQGNLGAAYLPPSTPSPKSKPLDELLTEVERRLIENALVKSRRNKTRAADFLGISRPRLYRRMKELNLEDESDSDEDANAIARP
jgi:PAS domain S-box-containing protein